MAAIESLSSTREPGPPTPVRVVREGRTLARTLGLGARCALRVWPLAALLALPGLGLAYVIDVPPSPTSVHGLLSIPLAQLMNAVLTAAALPSLMRWFRDSDEVLGPHARDLRGRLPQALVASLASSLLAILIGPALMSRALAAGNPPTGTALLWLAVAFFAGLWLQLRFMLVVAVATLETCDPLTALRRSWRLTAGRAALLTIIGSSCVLGLLYVLPMIVVAVARGADAVKTFTTRPWIGVAHFVALTPFFLAFSAVLYHDFRRRVDHVDSERIAAEAEPL